MIIKKISSKEINSIYQLGLQEFSGEYWLTPKFVKETVKERGIYLGAFNKNKLIGTVFVNVYDKPKAWIYFFVIDKENRRLGVGTKLLSTVEKKLPKGYFLLFVDIEESDKSALNFYKKNDFKRVASVKDWFGIGTTGAFYAKRLKK